MAIAWLRRQRRWRWRQRQRWFLFSLSARWSSSSQEWFGSGQLTGFHEERLKLGHHQVAGGQLFVVQLAEGLLAPRPGRASAVRRFAVVVVETAIQRLHVMHLCNDKWTFGTMEGGSVVNKKNGSFANRQRWEKMFQAHDEIAQKRPAKDGQRSCPRSDLWPSFKGLPRPRPFAGGLQMTTKRSRARPASGLGDVAIKSWVFDNIIILYYNYIVKIGVVNTNFNFDIYNIDMQCNVEAWHIIFMNFQKELNIKKQVSKQNMSSICAKSLFK